jgi:hypothetical protein
MGDFDSGDGRSGAVAQWRSGAVKGLEAQHPPGNINSYFSSSMRPLAQADGDNALWLIDEM